jgi:RNA polymerase sigma-70 factor, ECF subfamily
MPLGWREPSEPGRSGLPGEAAPAADRRVSPPGIAEIERVFRQEYGRAVAVLVRVFGDIDLAEDAVQEAFAIALERWPVSGVPPSAAGW